LIGEKVIEPRVIITVVVEQYGPLSACAVCVAKLLAQKQWLNERPQTMDGDRLMWPLIFPTAAAAAAGGGRGGRVIARGCSYCWLVHYTLSRFSFSEEPSVIASSPSATCRRQRCSRCQNKNDNHENHTLSSSKVNSTWPSFRGKQHEH